MAPFSSSFLLPKHVIPIHHQQGNSGFSKQHVDQFPIEKFRNHLRHVLKLCRLKTHFIHFLTNDENIKYYEQAFTHLSVGGETNYEWFEMMGDAILNKCMVYYISQRFPFLHNHEGVKVIARLKINLVSKKVFSDLSYRLGFFHFIRFQETCPKINSRSLLEDVLEAFFGVTEYLMDKHFEMGSGHVVCYSLLKNIMDQIPISLQYEELYDAITRLKETFDYFKTELWGQIKYENQRQEEGNQKVFVYQYCPQQSKKQLLWKCQGKVGQVLDEVKQDAAKAVLHQLQQRGYTKPTPMYYVQLQKYLTQIDRPKTFLFSSLLPVDRVDNSSEIV